jgi:uncharacterized protein (TIGR04222 family)
MRRLACVPRTALLRRFLIALTAALLGLAFMLATPSAGYAAGDEQITSYSVDLTLDRSGVMQVVETIAYDFGTERRHGIIREIPNEFGTGQANQVREYPIDGLEVDSPTGAPDQFEESQTGSTREIKIGDPDNGDVTGEQTYVIRYDVSGALNGFDDHQELYWNAIGSEWSVPIDSATVTVTGPAAINQTACFRGQQGSTDTCQSELGAGGSATYSTTGLASGQGLTVVSSWPLGTFASTAPIFKDVQTPGHAFSVNPGSGLGALAIFGLLAGGASALVMRRGRDEQYLGVTPGLEPGLGQESAVSQVGWRNRPVVAVQFTPPDGMRPGQLGTLIDEHANVVDVTATIVDLAVRGYLTIEEIPKEGWFGSDDWRLIEAVPAPQGGLHRYEQKLFNAIFEGRSEVLLSDLKTTFSADLAKVQELLYRDVTENGWFRGNPSSVRLKWQLAAGAVAVAGAALTVLLYALGTSVALLGVAVVLAGLVMLVLAPRMPARTPKGTALLAQAKGFQLYLEKAEANQIKWEEGQDIFSRYLPFAIVFGVAERWAKVFNDLAAQGANLAQPTWYSGSAYGHGAFNYLMFSSAMNGFASTTSGAIAAATPSSSGSSGFGGGGFSGGGGGGGGGGSW